jgi:hypothetical protein
MAKNSTTLEKCKEKRESLAREHDDETKSE